MTRNPWHLPERPEGRPGVRRRRSPPASSRWPPAPTAAARCGFRRPAAAWSDEADPRPGLGAGREGWLGLVVYGALARTVADSALVLDVMHGPRPRRTPALPDFDPRGRRAAAAAADRDVPQASARRDRRVRRSACRLGAHGAVARAARASGERARPRLRDCALEYTQTWVRGVHEEAAGTGRRGELERSTRQMAAAGR